MGLGKPDEGKINQFPIEFRMVSWPIKEMPFAEFHDFSYRFDDVN